MYGASASGTDTIAFAGAGGTLEFGDDPGLPNGMTLTGWASGENLDVRGVTDAAYVSGSFVLYDNGSTVGSFKVGTCYAGDSFDVVPLNNGYSQITIGPSWKNPVSGNFATAADWSTGSVPGTTDSVAISTAGTYTVSVTSSTTVRSIEETASKATVSIGASDVLTPVRRVQHQWRDRRNGDAEPHGRRHDLRRQAGRCRSGRGSYPERERTSRSTRFSTIRRTSRLGQERP